MKLKELLIFILGIFIAIFGFIMISGILIGIASNDYSFGETIFGDIIGGIILGVLPLLFGIFLCVKMKKKTKKTEENKLENEILKLAIHFNSKLTTSELAAHTTLSLTDAKQKLEEYVHLGVAERNISDSGIFVYVFTNIISENEKDEAKNLNNI
ncbi:hypothetical protein [Oceanobacillus sp. CF4.6]|uniref:hypothetical protein n=1 Tax=Oceanobacillus sp. CF4.6 TaxID=3373080 RepID=UPI003EE50836